MPTPSCHSTLIRSPLRPRKQKLSPPCGPRPSPCCTFSARLSIPQRMPVTPPAIQTFAQPETRSCPVQNLHQTRLHHRIDGGVDRKPAPVGLRDLDVVFAIGGRLGGRLAACRAAGIRSNLRCKKLRATASNKLTRQEIPTLPRQQCPRNLVTPSHRCALRETPKALFDNPNLLGSRPFPTPTFCRQPREPRSVI